MVTKPRVFRSCAAPTGDRKPECSYDRFLLGPRNFSVHYVKFDNCVGCSYSKFLKKSHELGPFLDLTWMA